MTWLLLVEDDERISQPLLRLLGTEGFATRHVTLGRDAIAAVHDQLPDLVLLDLSLPDIDGLDVCRELRLTHPTLPVIMLTARGEEVDLVVGFGAGADDYVVKPFRVGELVARIRARIRVATADEATHPDDSSHTGGLRVDRTARRVWLDEAELALSPKEFDLLDYLMQHAGATLRREQIMSDVWDEHWWGSTRTLDTHVASLRRKLGDRNDDPGTGRYIATIRGVGLRFEAH